MKKVLLWFACIVSVLGFGVSSASAAGFGFYGSLGGGSAVWEGSSSTVTFDTDTGHQGAGFVFDTAVAKDSFFNYQLNLGYDKFTNKSVSSGSKLELEGLMISNSFGFGLMRTEGFRLWLGPEIRVAFPAGSKSGIDLEFFGVGVGPVVGMNFNLPGLKTLQVKAGYQFMSYTGEASYQNAYGYTDYIDYDIDENLIYINFGVLFRSSGDVF